MSKPGLIDQAIRAVMPQRAIARAEARAEIAVHDARTAAAMQIQETVRQTMGANTAPQRQETRWRAASRVLRSLSTWIPGLGSATADLPKQERETIAARAYDAYRGHMIARAVITRGRSNIVGTGLMAHAAVDADYLGLEGEAADKLNGEIDREFAIWADNALECDWEAQQDFYGLQALALVSSMIPGDCFALTPEDERVGGQYGLKVQLVDGARVSNPNGRSDSKNLIDGIQLNDMGIPVGAWFCDRHPGDVIYRGVATWQYRPFFGESGRRRMMQIWNEKDRIGAVRGVSYLAPILEPLQQLEQYGRAELTAAVVSALFTVFIVKKAETFDAQGNPVPWVEGQTVKGGAGTTTQSQHPAAVPTPPQPMNIGLGSGAVIDLEPGSEPKQVSPTRPNAQFDPFFSAVMKQIGAALEIPVEELLLFYSSSYSAARAAMLQAWRFYVMRRTTLVQQFAAPMRELWFDEAVARGRLTGIIDYADPRRRAAYLRAVWIGPARGSMDEDKEAGAAIKRIEGGLSNESIEIPALMGEDRLTVYGTRKREVKQREKDGMVLGPQPGQAKQPAAAGGDPANPDDPKEPPLPDRRETETAPARKVPAPAEEDDT